MLEKENLFNLANRFLNQKIFDFQGPIMFGVPIDIKIKYKVKIIGEIKLIVAGNEKNFVNVEVEILEISPSFLQDFFKTPKDRYELERYYYYFSSNLKESIKNDLMFFNINQHVSIGKIYMKEQKTITEGTSSKKGVTRNIVKDIVSVFKKGEGEYYLPEDINGEVEYDFENINSLFSVEVKIVESENIDGFDIDGGFFSDNDTFEIDIHYNPKFFPELYYELIGELNDVVRHELQHLIQKERGVEMPKKEKDPETYYMQPHEIDAQMAGFRRVSKLRKEPIETTIRRWYLRRPNLSDEQKERLIKKIISTIS
jgi:hypothetical protein